jgi:branched-chain amino acid transport system substrate-binding protein
LPTRQVSHRRLAPVAALAAVLAAQIMPLAAAQGAEPIKLGIFLPLSGPAAAGGAANRLGYEMAIKEINAGGGIAGRTIEPVFADDQGDPTVGVGEIKRLVFQEKVDIVVGTQNSQVNLAALPVLNEAKVASISLTGSALLTPQAGPYHFSLAPSTSTLGHAMVDFAEANLKPSSVALLYDDGAAAKSGVEGIKAGLATTGIAIAAEQQYKFHPGDVTPQLLSLRRAEPDLLFLFSASQDDVGVVQKNKLEIGWDIKEVGSLGVAAAGALAVRMAGPQAFDNVLAQTYQRFTYCESTGKGEQVVSDFISAVQKFSGSTETRTDYFNIANGYDSVFIMKAAVEGGGATDGPSIATWIEGHAGELKVISAASLVAGKDSHFLVGPEALTMVEHPELRNDQGLQKRAPAC